MTTRLVHRPPRLTTALAASPSLTIAPPPTVADSSGRTLRMAAFLPLAGVVAAAVMIVVFRTSNPVFLLLGALLMVVAVVGGLGMLLGQRGAGARQRRVRRENYLDYLEGLRAETRERVAHERAQSFLLAPDPLALLDLVRDPARLWERRHADDDFLTVRVGVGHRPLSALAVPPPSDPLQPYDPFLAAEARAVAEQAGLAIDVPITVDLDRAGAVAVVGGRDEVLGVVRSILAQVAALHAPQDVGLAAAFPPECAPDWVGLDLLPHVLGPDGRRTAPSAAALGALLADEWAERGREIALDRYRPGPGPAVRSRRILVVDAYGRPAEPLPLPMTADLGVTVVYLLSDPLHAPPDTAVSIRVQAGRVQVGRGPSAVADLTTAALFEALARSLAPRRLDAASGVADRAGTAPTVTELLGIEDLDALTPAKTWRPRPGAAFLTVPIGVDDAGAPVVLDLKESAQLGMGPHGLVVGATGSGKSELLRTLLTGLVVAHPPEDLSLVLVDYKGGAAFAPFAALPHVAGLIDNLADDDQLIDRARASIQGEVVRRQAALKAAGHLPSIVQYRARADLPPMPHLLIVIDEFGELLTADPDFVTLLITIGRIGRSIGIHLLLSSQRIEASRLRGLETYLSYRIGLRTFSEAESHTILETKDAFSLPPLPGFAYLKVDTSVYRRFRAGFVSAPLEATEPSRRPSEVVLVPLYGGRVAPAAPSDRPPSTGPVLLSECVRRLQAPDREVRPIWLPPLPARVALSGVTSTPLRIELGRDDDPARQRQEPWTLDLARGGGHLAVIGAPQSGRSTVLRTLAVSAAQTHTPRQLGIYGLDLSGAGLRCLADFPHVGGVAARAQPDHLLRTVEELLTMLAARERVFLEHGLESMDDLRRRHADGAIGDLVSADLLVLVDGFELLRTEFEDLEAPLMQLLQGGSSYGIHLALAMTRWNDLRLAHQHVVGTRIELRLNDPVDSIIDRRLAALIRRDQPGRALTDERRFAQVALPVGTDAGLAAVSDLGRRAGRGWTGPVAAPIRVLPLRLERAQVPTSEPAPARVAFGLRQDTMRAACLDLADRDQHLIALGDPHAGKTTLAQVIVRGLVERMTPREIVFAVMDLRGELARSVPPAYLGAHATDAMLARGLAESVAAELRQRAADPRRADRRRIVVLADDYDMLAAGATDPLRPLLPYLAAARDLALNIVLTRPVAGSSRALFDPILQAIRDTGASLLLMSGERSEGPIVARTYAEALPPGRGRFIRRGEAAHLVQVVAA